MDIFEKDKLFLEHAEEHGWIFDIENGVVYNKNNKIIGSKTKHRTRYSYTLYFRHGMKTHAITRCRAIWLKVHGFIPNDLQPSHKSDDLCDDNINNIELTTTSYRAQRSKTSKKWKINNREKYSKMTLEIVNEARRLIREPNVSYGSLAKKYGVSRTTIIFAVQGRTWKDASEQPIPNGKVTILDNVKKSVSKKIKLEISEDSIRVVKSLLKNNSMVSYDGILRFLQMRNMDITGFNKITFGKIRKEIGLS